MTVAGAVYGNNQYVYDINAGIPKLLVERQDNQELGQYIWGNRLLGRSSPSGSDFYHQDMLGSTRLMTDLYGHAVNSYSYDVFGTPETVTSSVYNPFLFTGQIYDPSGLIYLTARYYDPATGRFLTEDTLFGELNDPLTQNLYVYCKNNPVGNVDPSGHMGEFLNYLNDNYIAPALNNFNNKYVGGPANQIASGDYRPVENFVINNSPAANLYESVSGKTIFTGKTLSSEQQQARVDNWNNMLVSGLVMSGGVKVKGVSLNAIPNNPGTLRRFVSNAEYKDLKKNGFEYNPKDPRGGISATSIKVQPRNPDSIRRSTGALGADRYVDINTTNKNVILKGKTKGGLPDYKIKSNVRPNDIVGSGKVLKK